MIYYDYNDHGHPAVFHVIVVGPNQVSNPVKDCRNLKVIIKEDVYSFALSFLGCAIEKICTRNRAVIPMFCTILHLSKRVYVYNIMI